MYYVSVHTASALPSMLPVNLSHPFTHNIRIHVDFFFALILIECKYSFHSFQMWTVCVSSIVQYVQTHSYHLVRVCVIFFFNVRVFVNVILCQFSYYKKNGFFWFNLVFIRTDWIIKLLSVVWIQWCVLWWSIWMPNRSM